MLDRHQGLHEATGLGSEHIKPKFALWLRANFYNGALGSRGPRSARKKQLDRPRPNRVGTSGKQPPVPQHTQV